MDSMEEAPPRQSSRILKKKKMTEEEEEEAKDEERDLSEKATKALRLVLEIAKERDSLMKEHNLDEVQTDDMTESAFL